MTSNTYECFCTGCSQVMQYDTESMAKRFRYFHLTGCHAEVKTRVLSNKTYSDVPAMEEKIPEAHNEGYAN